MANVAAETSDAGVRTICIDREDRRNALDRATLAELIQAFDEAGADPAVRVIVLRGAGDRAFCAGADLKELLDHESIDASREHFDAVRVLIERMHGVGQPVIARVPGFALAGGCGLAVAADFTLAGESAVFGLPEIGIGLLPLMVSAPILRAIGSRKALLDLVLTGRRVDAREAQSLGLTTRVVPDADLDGEIGRLCETLAGHSPTALRMGKEALYTMGEMEYGAAMKYLREMIVLTSRTEDAAEGIRAFFEKRKPVWTGR
ncbi:MAG: enoyl-CoA hydratase-related protein [Proteobacteria bacterium]|nr:enoyl-CoA hydratase-related protein [Pseudomonadota bacterium]